MPKLFLLGLAAVFVTTFVVEGRAEKIITLNSPDKKTELRIAVGSSISYSVWYENRSVVGASPISMTIDGHVLGQEAKIQRIQRDSINSFISPLYGKFSRL